MIEYDEHMRAAAETMGGDGLRWEIPLLKWRTQAETDKEGTIGWMGDECSFLAQKMLQIGKQQWEEEETQADCHRVAFIAVFISIFMSINSSSFSSYSILSSPDMCFFMQSPRSRSRQSASYDSIPCSICNEMWCEVKALLLLPLIESFFSIVQLNWSAPILYSVSCISLPMIFLTAVIAQTESANR